MGVPSLELGRESETDTYPFLMEPPESLNSTQHVLDIPSREEASSSNLYHGRLSNGSNTAQLEDRPSVSTRTPAYQPSFSSSNGSNNRNSAVTRRGEARRRRSPSNSGLWISVELFLTLSQIIAAIIVLSLSANEHPHEPLFVWIVGYMSGCVATLPLLYWRYRYRNQSSEQGSAQSRQSPQINVSGGLSLSVSRSSEGEDRQTAGPSPRSSQGSRPLSARVKAFVEYFKMALDCFFAVWFVVGNVWIFGRHESASHSPNLYRLCIAFLAISCIGYAMPFLLCATICCCLPCMISILGFREDLTQTRGATAESIEALPIYKFKLKKSRTGDDVEIDTGAGEGGHIAAGTDGGRMISGEDAVCCICLAKYGNNEELRELPCSHLFHKDCVDKWLKLNASCPLCKVEVGESNLGGSNGTNTGMER